MKNEIGSARKKFGTNVLHMSGYRATLRDFTRGRSVRRGFKAWLHAGFGMRSLSSLFKG